VFREYLIKKNLIISITECPKNTFEEAVVETSIIQLRKGRNDNFLTINDLANITLNTLDKNLVNSENNFNFLLSLTPREQCIINRLKNENPKVDDYFDVIWGIKVYEKGKGYPPQNGSESKSKLFHSNVKEDDNYKPLIGGSNILPYQIKWDNSYIKYGPWIAAPRQPEWFINIPRIVVREITSKGRINAAYIEDEFVFSNSVDGIRSKTNDSKALLQLLGFLNSKLASWLHIKSSSNSQKDAFPKVLIQNLRDFPYIPKINDCLVRTIQRVIEQKNENPSIDTSNIEDEIDKLVYELYELTEEEIKIIES
jgi:hypothetical protein